MAHIPVLLQPSIDGLHLKPGAVFVDMTVNGGGHSSAVAEKWGRQVKIIGIDLDQVALDKSKMLLATWTDNFELKRSNFRYIDTVLKSCELSPDNSVDAVLMDLGLSSNQFEESGRGFSFQNLEEPLMMTFAQIHNLSPVDVTAEKIVNNWDEENIATILESYGEERYAKKIAKKIVEQRAVKPIKTVGELVQIIKTATPNFYHHLRIHPATKTFQGLRITVNDEIRSLQEGLEKGFAALKTGGRMVVIAFHSIEDRRVKNFFRELVKEDRARAITKKPIVPSPEEIEHNRRSRSAKLRIIEKI